MRLYAVSILAGLTAIASGSLPAAPSLAIPAPNIPKIAQKVPVGTVGQISSNRTVRVVVLNNTSVTLFAGISGGSRVELPRGANTAFAFDSTPINVFIYPAGREISLKYNTTVQGNTVTVQVTQAGGDTPGDGAININRAGAVYIY